MIGSFKTFGVYGPTYQVLDIAGEDPISGIMVQIVMVETGEKAILPYEDVLNDPNAP